MTSFRLHAHSTLFFACSLVHVYTFHLQWGMYSARHTSATLHQTTVARHGLSWPWHMSLNVLLEDCDSEHNGDCDSKRQETHMVCCKNQNPSHFSPLVPFINEISVRIFGPRSLGKKPEKYMAGLPSEQGPLLDS
jgi:hypothetical protein